MSSTLAPDGIRDSARAPRGSSGVWVSILARPASVFEWRGPSGRFFCSGERSRRGVVRQDARALTRIATPEETLTPLLPGKTLDEARWTRFERAQLEALHAALLAELVFPGLLQADYRVNFVDQRLSAPGERYQVVVHVDAPVLADPISSAGQSSKTERAFPQKRRDAWRAMRAGS